MSKSTSMSVLLGFVLLGAWVLSKSKKDTNKRVDVIGGGSRKTIPLGYHIMPDGSLMKDSEHDKLPTGEELPAQTPTLGGGGIWFPASPAQGW